MINKVQNPATSQQGIDASEFVAKCMEAIEDDNSITLGGIVKTDEQANLQLPSCPRHDLLVHAVRHRSHGAVELLLDRGANPNVVFCDCERIDDYESLLEGHYVSALMLAVNLSEAGLVQLLLARGADLHLPIFVFADGMVETCGDRIDSSGTPAMRAAAEKWLLQQQGADDELRDGEPSRL